MPSSARASPECQKSARLVDFAYDRARKMQWIAHPDGWHAIACAPRSGELARLSVEMGVGSADDPTGREGTAHLLEHVLVRVGRLGERIEQVGGRFLASTDHDRIAFRAVVPRKHAAYAASALAEAVAQPRIHADALARERSLVELERCASHRDSGSVLRDELLRRVFLAHPYRNPVLGTEASCARVELADLERLMAWGWSARNLRVVSDDGSPAVLDAFAIHLRKLSRHAVSRLMPREPVPAAPRVSSLAGVGRNQVALAWRWEHGGAAMAAATAIAYTFAHRAMGVRVVPLRDGPLFVAVIHNPRDIGAAIGEVRARLAVVATRLASATVKGRAAVRDAQAHALAAPLLGKEAFEQFVADYQRMWTELATTSVPLAVGLASPPAAVVATAVSRAHSTATLGRALGASAKPRKKALSVDGARHRAQRPRLADLTVRFSPPAAHCASAYRLMVAALGGNAGILARRLRDRESLAYDLWVDVHSDGGLGIRLRCIPSRRTETEAALADALSGLLQLPRGDLLRARAQVSFAGGASSPVAAAQWNALANAHQLRHAHTIRWEVRKGG